MLQVNYLSKTCENWQMNMAFHLIFDEVQSGMGKNSKENGRNRS